MRSSGALNDVSEEWKAVRERGVKIDYTIRYGVDPAVGMNIANVTAFVDQPTFSVSGGGTGALTAEAKAVINNHSDGSAAYNVFYLDGGILQDATLNPAQSNSYASGVAFQEFLLNGANKPFANNALLSGRANSTSSAVVNLMSPSHELAHLLVNNFGQNPPQASDPSHHSDSRNLLFDQSSNSRSRLGTKRLDSWQEGELLQEIGAAP